MTNPTTPSTSGVSRRTIVKGAAWAVPVITVASAVPAMAASQCNQFTLDDANSCKTSGNPFYYKLRLCLTSTCSGTGVFPLTVTKIETNNDTYLTETQWGGPSSPGTPITTMVFNSSTCVTVDGYAHGSVSTLTIYWKQANGTTGSFPGLAAPPSQGGCTVPA